jgi:hypothetical protein
MKLSKAETREKKQNKRKNGMQVDNRAAFLLEEQKVKRANKNKEGK